MFSIGGSYGPGWKFGSDLFQGFCKLLEIINTRGTPYHPSSNGQVEVCNRTILQMIISYLSRGLRNRDEYLPIIAKALYSMKNRSTVFSANMLMLGRETIQPIDLMLGLSRHTPQNPSNWVESLSHNLSNTHSLAREMIGKTQLRLNQTPSVCLLSFWGLPTKMGNKTYRLSSAMYRDECRFTYTPTPSKLY